MSAPFRPRPLTDFERQLMLDTARGLTADQSARSRGLSYHQVVEAQRKVRELLGASNAAHAVALAMAFGDIGFHEITGPAPRRKD